MNNIVKLVLLLAVATGTGGISGIGAAGAGAPVAPVAPNPRHYTQPCTCCTYCTPSTVPPPLHAPYLYAIQGARIVPVSGAAVDNGTIVVRDGLITAVGANARCRLART